MLVQDLKEKYGATMTPKEVAAELHQHPTHVRELCKRGQLPAARIGERWHVNTAKFAAILDGFNE